MPEQVVNVLIVFVAGIILGFIVGAGWKRAQIVDGLDSLMENGALQIDARGGLLGGTEREAALALAQIRMEYEANKQGAVPPKGARAYPSPSDHTTKAIAEFDGTRWHPLKDGDPE